MRRPPTTPCLLIATCLLGLAAACTENGSLPTEPARPADDDWTVLYAPTAYLEAMVAVWAMDSDDVWIALNRGALLHYDGRNLVRHDVASNGSLRDVDGCATDEVWAVGDRVALRWDGRRWTEFPLDDAQLYTVLCEAPDRVYAGGYGQRFPFFRFPVVHRWTGRGWKTWELPSSDGEVRKLWRPHAGGPLFAIVADSVRHAYRIDEGRWDLLDWPGAPIDADGDLVLLENDDSEFPAALYRLEPDETLTPLCEQFRGDRILQARAPLVGFSHGLQYEVDCARRTVLDATPEKINDIALPERPGAAATSVFVVGRFGMAMVGGWRSDWTMEWRQFSPVESYDLRRPMLGDGTELFIPYVTDDSRGIFVRSSSGWHLEPLGYIPDGLRFLADGDLLVWNETWGNAVYGEIHRRDASGAWHALPPTERVTRGVWGSTTDDLVAMTDEGEFLRLVEGAWVLQDHLGGDCTWFDGSAADRLFAVVLLPELGRRLIAFDGTIWRNVMPEDVDRVDECYLGPHSGTLYAGFRSGWDYVPRKSVDGRWEDFPEGHEHRVYTQQMTEGTDGGLYVRDGRRIDRLYHGGWKLTYEQDEYLQDIFVHPDRGLFAVDDHDRLYHHPYRPR